MRTKGVFLGVLILLLALCASVLSGTHISQSDKRTVSAPDFPKPIGKG
jgi:hypothetical protein